MSGPHTEDPRLPEMNPLLSEALKTINEFGAALARAYGPALEEIGRAMSVPSPFLASVADLPDPPRPFTEHPPTVEVRRPPDTD